MDSCRIIGNRAFSKAPGLHVEHGSVVSVNHCVISNNSNSFNEAGQTGSTDAGCAVLLEGNNRATFYDVNLTHNSGYWGLGVLVLMIRNCDADCSRPSVVKVISCNFHHNEAKAAIVEYTSRGYITTYERCNIHDNIMFSSAAVVFNGVGSSSTMSDCAIHNNVRARQPNGGNRGGGVSVELDKNGGFAVEGLDSPAEVTLNRCSIYENGLFVYGFPRTNSKYSTTTDCEPDSTAVCGGGLQVISGNVYLNDGKIYNNWGTNGAGIYQRGGVVTLSRTLIFDNRLYADGYDSSASGRNVMTVSIMYYLLPTPPGSFAAH